MKKQNVGIFLLGSILFSSCVGIYYVPNTMNVPLFKEKNEVRASASFGPVQDPISFDFQGAYSITNNFAVMSNAMYAFESGNAHHYYLDGGVGYFKPLNKFFVFEVFSGLGGSFQKHTYQDIYSSQLIYLTNYIQPSIGLSLDFLDVAFSTRINQLSFVSVTDNGPYSYLDDFFHNRNYLTINPAVTVRLGWKYVKFQEQVSYCIFYNEPTWGYKNFSVNMGLCFSFAERYYRKKQDKQPTPLP